MGFPVEWELETLDNVDYELVLTTKAKKGLFNKMFRLTAKAAKAKGQTIPDEVGEAEEFEASPAFFNLARTATHKVVKEAVASVREDGINILNGSVKRVFFSRKGREEWQIIITYRGQYEKC
jgi:hypothetical protein